MSEPLRETTSQRWKCGECGNVSVDILSAPNPFDAALDCVGCVECKAVDSLTAACWKCDRQAGSGTPTKEHGYVWSCYEHQPERPIAALEK